MLDNLRDQPDLALGQLARRFDVTRIAEMRMMHPNVKTAMAVGEALEFESPHRYAQTFQMTNINEPTGVMTHKLAKERQQIANWPIQGQRPIHRISPESKI